MLFNRDEVKKQKQRRDKLLVGIRPLETALSDQYSLTLGLGKNVQKNYLRLLRASVDLLESLERISMEYSTVKARVYAERTIEYYQS